MKGKAVRVDVGTLVHGKKITSIEAVITRADGEVVDLGKIAGDDMKWTEKVRAWFRIKKENRRYARRMRLRAKEGQRG